MLLPLNPTPGLHRQASRVLRALAPHVASPISVDCGFLPPAVFLPVTSAVTSVSRTLSPPLVRTTSSLYVPPSSGLLFMAPATAAIYAIGTRAPGPQRVRRELANPPLTLERVRSTVLRRARLTPSHSVLNTPAVSRSAVSMAPPAAAAWPALPASTLPSGASTVSASLANPADPGFEWDDMLSYEQVRSDWLFLTRPNLSRCTLDGAAFGPVDHIISSKLAVCFLFLFAIFMTYGYFYYFFPLRSFL